MTSTLPQQLVDLLGAEAVLPSEKLSEYAVDGLVPQAVVQPTDRKAISQVLKWASAEGKSVSARGGGTKLALGNTPKRLDLVLDLSRYRKVLDYQPADLTVTVEAGIPLAALQQELARGGKFVALESPRAQQATIGGILATAASGPLRFTYGLARDWLIGISVIGPGGVETKAGGRVVKNVTGYDLNKLYTGSLGTLGVIVEATFKLSPLPAAFRALIAAFPSVPEGIEASRVMLSQVSAPQGVQVVNAPVLPRLDLPEDSQAPALAIAFFAGRPRGVERRLEESTRLLLDKGANRVQRLEESAGNSLRQSVTDLGWSPDTAPLLGIKVNLPPTEVGKLSASLAEQDIPVGARGIVADVGFGTTQLLWWPDQYLLDATTGAGVEPGESPIIGAIEQVRELVGGLGGSVVVDHCPLQVKRQIDVWGQAAASMEIMRRIKGNFDPQGVLNPGRFMGGL
ncbi:MAG: FAD-binding oxidoreductase [Dehalococcoidia bacterium]